VEGSNQSPPREDVDAVLELFDLGLLTWQETRAELTRRGLKREAVDDLTGGVDEGEDARSNEE
jgi:hypothetical protein